jgi:glutaredoxin
MKISIQDLVFFFVLAVFMAWSFSTGISSFLQTPIDKGDVVVYGSKTCPWCVKQEDYLTNKGIDYKFVDCSKGQCPAFVNGFPTLVVNGQVKEGYSEI